MKAKMQKDTFRVILECFSRDIIVIASLMYLGEKFANYSLSLGQQFFLGMTGFILIWWVVLPFYDHIRDYLQLKRKNKTKTQRKK